MKTVGIIGFGSFGGFLAEKLDGHCKVLVWSQSGKENRWQATIEQVAAADFVVPSVPIDAYPELLEKLKPILGTQTVIVDVCSVKEKPVEVIQRILPDQPLVATHPLFGPESAKDSLTGHTVVMCPEVSDSTAFGNIRQLCEQLGLEVQVMSAAEHDKQMALVHGLTFFIAHALKDLNIHDQTLGTPSFRRLVHLAELERQHSDELFHTIQSGNPYTGKIREKFIQEVIALDKSIQEHK